MEETWDIPEEDPCIGVCTMDPESGTCLGCGRTAEQIAGLPPASPASGKDDAPPPSGSEAGPSAP